MAVTPTPQPSPAMPASGNPSVVSPAYTPPPPVQSATTALTNAAIAVAQAAPGLLTTLQTVNPALAAQLTGSLATYSKSAAAPIVGLVVGAVVAHFGLACSATTVAAAGCWSPDTINLVTEICCAAGTGIGALAMHWLSKAPARSVLAETTATTKGT